MTSKKSEKKIATLTAVTCIAVIGMLLVSGTNLIQIANASAPGPAWLRVMSGDAKALLFGDVQYSVKTHANIPTNQFNGFIKSNVATGFAWADTSTGKAFVVAIHPSFIDSNQSPMTWHAHLVSLTGGATAPNDFCVASVDSAPITEIQINGDTLTVLSDQLPTGETPASLNAKVGFTLQHDLACASTLAVKLST